MANELMDAVESLGRALGVRLDGPMFLDIDRPLLIVEGNPGPDQSWVWDRFVGARPKPFVKITEEIISPQIRHIQRREGDEWVCRCGLRWSVDDPAPPAGHHGC